MTARIDRIEGRLVVRLDGAAYVLTLVGLAPATWDVRRADRAPVANPDEVIRRAEALACAAMRMENE